MADSEDAESLTRQLSNLVSNLKQQGILDEFFDVAYKVKEDTGDPLFFLQTASAFASKAEGLINNLNRAMRPLLVDFNDIFEYHISLKGSCSSLGLCGMVLGCADLENAINRQSREGCIKAMARLDRESQIIKDRLAAILKLERKILAHNMGKS